MMPIVEGGDVVEGLGERVLGRVTAADGVARPALTKCWSRPAR